MTLPTIRIYRSYRGRDWWGFDLRRYRLEEDTIVTLCICIAGREREIVCRWKRGKP